MPQKQHHNLMSSGRQLGFISGILPMVVVFQDTIQNGLSAWKEVSQCLEERNAYDAEKPKLQHTNPWLAVKQVPS